MSRNNNSEFRPKMFQAMTQRMQELVAQPSLENQRNSKQLKAQKDAKREAEERRQMELTQIPSSSKAQPRLALGKPGIAIGVGGVATETGLVEKVYEEMHESWLEQRNTQPTEQGKLMGNQQNSKKAQEDAKREAEESIQMVLTEFLSSEARGQLELRVDRNGYEAEERRNFRSISAVVLAGISTAFFTASISYMTTPLNSSILNCTRDCVFVTVMLTLLSLGYILAIYLLGNVLLGRRNAEPLSGLSGLWMHVTGSNVWLHIAVIFVIVFAVVGIASCWVKVCLALHIVASKMRLQELLFF